ncbi:mechanosensitive ion channel domain-containing protein [Sulfurimonas sp.]|uniref:mechanosensitive ion channel domain-containing protein n=1 Tax=Sulfurimonas sp. TaxID=2022749 RepID=UPI00356763C5
MMRKFLYLLLLSSTLLFAVEQSENIEKSKNIWDSKNIWIKTYVNNKNYYTIINNIVKIEQKIKKNKNNQQELAKLKRRLDIQKSKLELYERNKSFDELLKEYKFSVPEITAYDYFYKNSKNKLVKMIDHLIDMKNELNKASSLLNSYYEKNKNSSVSLEDIKYFEEFLENINKTYINLTDARDLLDKKYEEYYNEKLQKHLITLMLLVVVYTFYRIFLFIYTLIETKLKNDINHIHRKIISLIFYSIILVALVVRYLEDFMYIITFLSVVAAALTIALREVILNIVASIYIFFSNMIRVGDRIMVQFETKHTIGDIQDISLMKIKLHEIEDYSNLKEIKNVGRTIFIPNSYVFTKVFYNYSRKKDALINDLIEFEFKSDNDFEVIEKITKEVLLSFNVPHTITFTLNNLKTGVIGLISYQVNYKLASKMRGEISIKLLQAYNQNENIKLKTSKAATKSNTDEAEG